MARKQATPRSPRSPRKVKVDGFELTAAEVKQLQAKCEGRAAKRARAVAALDTWLPNIASIATLAGHWYFLMVVQRTYMEMEDTRAMPFDYLPLWTYIFAASIIAESLYSWWFDLGLYRFSDAVASLLLGTWSTLTKIVAVHLGVFGMYHYVYDNFRVYTFEDGVTAFWVMLFVVEFCYYWVHRTGHTMNCFWALHGVHHGAEEYNLATALRQSAWHQLVSQFYYVPAALLFSPAVFFVHSQFNLLYQYWIHTSALPKLGPLEWFLNTPSQHRVHHGRNEYCIDTNYGGTLCVFDRLFGTFQDELEEIPIVYGQTHSLNTFEPIEGNVRPWRGILSNMWHAEGLVNKLYVLVQGPGWIVGEAPDAHYPIPPASLSRSHPYDTDLPTGFKVYIAAQMVLGLAFTSEVIMKPMPGTPTLYVAVYFAFATWCFSNCGHLLDRRPFMLLFEPLRILCTPALALLYLHMRETGAAVPSSVAEVFAQVDHPSFLYVAAATAVVLAVWLSLSNTLTVRVKDREMGFDLPGVAQFEEAEVREAAAAGGVFCKGVPPEYA